MPGTAPDLDPDRQQGRATSGFCPAAPAITQLSIPRPVDQGTVGPGILWTTSRADSGRRVMSLIASVLHLDRRAVKALRITDPYSLHRVIYSLYPDVRSEAAKAASEASGILYADQGGDFYGRKILLL